MAAQPFKLGHAAMAFLPLALTPAVLLLLASELIDAGGGEKDIILTLPYFVWALIFFICALALIVKRWALSDWLRRSLAVSITVMLFLWMLAFLTNSLGIA